MNPIIYHFVSGNAFFSGLGLIILAGLSQFFCQRKWVMYILRWLAVLGFALVIASSTPLPLWYYGGWGLFFICWLLFRKVNVRERKKIETVFCLLVLSSSLLGVIWELPYHTTPVISGKFETFYVIGDSISAGIGQEKRTWPRIIQDDYHIGIINLAQSGATAGSAFGQTDKITLSDALVLLEIGGNDLLGRGSDFEGGLVKLLSKVKGPGRTVVMLELPLFPFKYKYGEIQRRLAEENGIILIPKRYFAEVILSSQGTLDRIHLSNIGHQRMAQMVWNFIGHAMIRSK